MRPWAWVRRLLALIVAFVFMLGVLVTPALAAGSSRSSSSGFKSSGSRSFSTPKPSAPSSPPRSFSTPKPSTTPAPKSSTSPAPSRSFSSPPPPTTTTPNKSYSSPPQNYSSGDRSYSSPDRSFSSERPTATPKAGASTPSPPPTYDRGRTSYPTRPPVIIYGPSPYDPPYWHDWYYARPWYWRMWHRPVYYTDSGWGISWLSVVGFGIGIWILLGIISAMMAKRRRG